MPVKSKVVVESLWGRKLTLGETLAVDGWDISMDAPVYVYAGNSVGKVNAGARTVKQRKIAVSGMIAGVDKPDLETLLSRYADFFASEPEFKLWRYDGAPRYLRCVADGISAPYVRGRFKGRVANLNLSMFTADPFWRGPDTLVSQSITAAANLMVVDNIGTAETPAYLILDSGAANTLSSNVFRNYGRSMLLDPGFEADGNGWTAGAGTKRISQLYSAFGSKSLELRQNDRIVQTVPVLAGKYVNLSCYAFAPAAATLQLYIQWKPGLTTTTSNVSVTPGWNRFSVTALVPASQTTADVGFLNAGVPYIYVDGAMFEVVNTAVSGPSEPADYPTIDLSFGSSVTFSSGQRIVVDSEAMTILKDGVSILGQATAGVMANWIKLYPGRNVLVFGAHTMTASLRFAPRFY